MGRQSGVPSTYPTLAPGLTLQGASLTDFGDFGSSGLLEPRCSSLLVELASGQWRADMSGEGRRQQSLGARPPPILPQLVSQEGLVHTHDLAPFPMAHRY